MNEKCTLVSLLSFRYTYPKTLSILNPAWQSTCWIMFPDSAFIRFMQSVRVVFNLPLAYKPFRFSANGTNSLVQGRTCEIRNRCHITECFLGSHLRLIMELNNELCEIFNFVINVLSSEEVFKSFFIRRVIHSSSLFPLLWNPLGGLVYFLTTQTPTYQVTSKYDEEKTSPPFHQRRWLKPCLYLVVNPTGRVLQYTSFGSFWVKKSSCNFCSTRSRRLSLDSIAV